MLARMAWLPRGQAFQRFCGQPTWPEKGHARCQSRKWVQKKGRGFTASIINQTIVIYVYLIRMTWMSSASSFVAWGPTHQPPPPVSCSCATALRFRDDQDGKAGKQNRMKRYNSLRNIGCKQFYTSIKVMKLEKSTMLPKRNWSSTGKDHFDESDHQWIKLSRLLPVKCVISSWELNGVNNNDLLFLLNTRPVTCRQPGAKKFFRNKITPTFSCAWAFPSFHAHENDENKLVN